jgi:hypothetical protein
MTIKHTNTAIIIPHGFMGVGFVPHIKKVKKEQIKKTPNPVELDVTVWLAEDGKVARAVCGG